MHGKELLVKGKHKRHLQMKSKTADLEINEANDRGNNSKVNLITIAAVKIKNNNEQI